MAKEGQTTSRLGSQSVFNSVQEVGRRMVIWKKGWAAFEEDRSPRMVERHTTKAGGSEEGLAYFLRLESECEKKERGFVPRRDLWSGMVAISSSG
jgi:hypothetical protein